MVQPPRSMTAWGGRRPIAALSFVSWLSRSRRILRRSEARRRSEAAKLALDQASERDSRVVFKIPADDLHSDRQTVAAMANRRSRRWPAVQRSDAGPHPLIEIRYLVAIDVELPGVSRRVIVREGHARHRRAEHYVHFLEQRQPAGTQPGADTAFSGPLGMAHHL